MTTEIEVAIERIFLWGDDAFPIFRSTFNLGATDLEILELETKIGASLPEEVRSLYRICNGQRNAATGLFFGCELLTLNQIFDEWAVWRDVLTDNPEINSEMLHQSSWPNGAVDPVYINLGWIPISRDFGGNNIGIDLAPGPNGIFGQVIIYGRDEDQKIVLGLTLLHVLQWLGSELHKGNFELTEHDEGDDGIGYELNMAHPNKGHFHDSARILCVERDLPYLQPSSYIAPVTAPKVWDRIRTIIGLA
jgi:internalin A